MLSNLLSSGTFGRDIRTYVQDNLLQSIVLGVIALLLIAIAIVLIVLSVKSKKQLKAQQAAEAEKKAAAEAEKEAAEAAAKAEAEKEAAEAAEEEAPVSEEECAEEEPAEEPIEEVIEETPAEETVPEEAEEVPVEEEVPAEEPEEAPVEEETPAEEPEEESEPLKSAAGGKWVIELTYKNRYGFKLYAANGQVMLESATPYANLATAKSGIKTYQDNIAADRFDIVEHKNGDFQVQILNARGGPLAFSSTYSTRSGAESARDSIKRWARTDSIEVKDEQ